MSDERPTTYEYLTNEIEHAERVGATLEDPIDRQAWVTHAEFVRIHRDGLPAEVATRRV